MHPNLAKKLIEMGAIRQGSSISVYYHGHGLSGQNDALLLDTFSIKTAHVTKEGDVSFVAYGGLSNDLRKFHCTEILALDGMDAERVAKTYNLSLDGTNEVIGKRRGRRKKVIVPEEDADTDSDE